ncbi:MAG: lytic transglycosylase domain-containing protein [Candidatus Gastranaerophilales bacterium]|nr:lytic transglycosylase domain-containing protein [Candidatus Gastranaerophilales bacterium]
MKRVVELETMVEQKTKTVDTQTTKPSKFSDVLQMVPPVEFKYQIQEPQKITRSDIAQMVQKAASSAGIDPKLIMSVIKQESGFNPNAISKAGAQGLMQLMPATAKSLGVTNAFNPQENIEGGVKYLKGLLDRFNGNKILALAAYNAGPNAVTKYNGIPPYAETQNYVKSILKNYL